jgi:acetyl esterase/lipase
MLVLCSTWTASAQQSRVPDGVKVRRNIPYVTDGHERNLLDLFVPENVDGPLPLIIWIHGGGWQNGSKENCLPLRQGYTQQGYAVASINYRLTSHAVFPAQVEDCKAAIRWLRAHAAENNIDPDRFGAWGSSAGGHLVALVGTSGDVSEFDVGEHLKTSSRVQAVCDYYGPTDFTVFVTTPGYESHAKVDSPEGKLVGGLVMENAEKAARLNPITYVSKDDPPFLIIHGDSDGTVPFNQSQLLYEAMKEAGTSVHFHTIHGAGHGGPGFTTPVVQTMVQKFFARELKGPSSQASPTASTSESTAPENKGGGNRSNRRGRDGNSRQLSFDRVLAERDQNKDGKLSRDEVPSRQLFERIDANNDGVITREEHQRVYAPAEKPAGF